MGLFYLEIKKSSTSTVDPTGVTAFSFTFPDTNSSGNEETVKVYVKEFDKRWEYDDYYTLDATFRRVYEA